jgi:hypothetical protein
MVCCVHSPETGLKEWSGVTKEFFIFIIPLLVLFTLIYLFYLRSSFNFGNLPFALREFSFALHKPRILLLSSGCKIRDTKARKRSCQISVSFAVAGTRAALFSE